MAAAPWTRRAPTSRFTLAASSFAEAPGHLTTRAQCISAVSAPFQRHSAGISEKTWSSLIGS
jgi:hypothetical protein